VDAIKANAIAEKRGEFSLGRIAKIAGNYLKKNF
jgi:hypothetical protein